MTAFQASTDIRSISIHPYKRVNYALGMVLGVDDFVQESTWHAEALRHVLRDLIGYGTVRGLWVSPRDTQQGPEVVVAPGVALTPQGRVARVPVEQCANLNQWLDGGGQSTDDARQAHREAVEKAVEPGSLPDTGFLTVHVVLDAAECTTDPRPIPGEPCRREDDVLADSRIQDAFALSLRLRPPQQIEVSGERELLHWLASAEVTDAAAGDEELAAFLAELEAAAISGSQIEPPSMLPPPIVPIPRSDAQRWLRAALRRYVTKLRANQLWLAEGQDATGAPPSDPAEDDPPGGVLLASVQLELFRTQSGWQVLSEPDAVRIDDGERPFLVPADFCKEACVSSLAAALGSGAAPSPVPLSPLSSLPRSASRPLDVQPSPRARIVAAGMPEVVAKTAQLPLEAPGTAGYLVAQEQGAGKLRVVFDAQAVLGARYLLHATPVQGEADPATRAISIGVVSGPAPIAGQPPRRLAFELQVRKGSSFLSVVELKKLQLMLQITVFVPGDV